MFHECDVCGGSVFQRLGKLGDLLWYRCRRCGAECCFNEDENEGVDTNYGAW